MGGGWVLPMAVLHLLWREVIYWDLAMEDSRVYYQLLYINSFPYCGGAGGCSSTQIYIYRDYRGEQRSYETEVNLVEAAAS